MTKVTLCKLHPAGGGHPTVEVARASNRKDLNFFEKKRQTEKRLLYFEASLITATPKANKLSKESTSRFINNLQPISVSV